MSDPYIGEIRMFGGTFAPVGWLACDGSILNISDYDILFNLIGTTYGGNGTTTFGIPDLRGRLPLHQGTNGSTAFSPGTLLGNETVTLTTGQMPTHSHALGATTGSGTQASPQNGTLAAVAQVLYGAGEASNAFSSCIAPAGGSQPHDNMMPFLAVSFIIATEGIYPSQT